ncbi:hypothetical protein GB931_05535 [Modestobacter sp. I12A-02628]|uniref:Uncharacterized protein n=1 Tax=Goekera deserti TaxID=2497753 RepID=A0A7K3WBB8_9ACTN|nr:hypothetical protein [Goekera deserti]MPQ97395.1 hypothetical protein [Goekera deserti]NDI48004.1 hypothetical protein [Goekera deserti]NEL53752.1 hypothetical protein [Goekera deserti]
MSPTSAAAGDPEAVAGPLMRQAAQQLRGGLLCEREFRRIRRLAYQLRVDRVFREQVLDAFSRDPERTADTLLALGRDRPLAEIARELGS